MSSLSAWIAFNLFVLGLLALDLFVFHREAHEVRTREALAWTGFWIVLALAFNAVVWHYRGPDAGLEFFTGWLVEKALSVDNIFVFVLIFSWFNVPLRYQHRVLFWGVLGALVMRGVMIAAGTWLIHAVHEIIYVFGAFLILSGIRVATQDVKAPRPEANPVLRLVRRVLPVSSDYHGQRFLAREASAPGGRLRRVATPLLVVLILVETTDLIFAVDSIPAVFAITDDPFIVYTSNVFAILGMRALYFLLAGVIHRFHFLKLGLAVVLVFVGAKMLVSDFVTVPVAASLAVIGTVLAGSIVASLIRPPDPGDPSITDAEDSRPPVAAARSARLSRESRP